MFRQIFQLVLCIFEKQELSNLVVIANIAFASMCVSVAPEKMCFLIEDEGSNKKSAGLNSLNASFFVCLTFRSFSSVQF